MEHGLYSSYTNHSCRCQECKDAYAAYRRRYRQKTNWAAERRQREKRQRLIARAKERPCADCGNFYPSIVMDFDHVRGEKKFNVSRAGTRSLQLVMKEIAKCDVVCANCHRIRTGQRGGHRVYYPRTQSMEDAR